MRIKNDGNVGIGTDNPQTLLDVRGKINIEFLATGAPTNGTYGGDGTRLILYGGSPTSVPYSLGISGGRLWYSVPVSAMHDFYIGTNNVASIFNTGYDILGLKMQLIVIFKYYSLLLLLQ
jgi:hypothetical protein